MNIFWNKWIYFEYVLKQVNIFYSMRSTDHWEKSCLRKTELSDTVEPNRAIGRWSTLSTPSSKALKLVGRSCGKDLARRWLKRLRQARVLTIIACQNNSFDPDHNQDVQGKQEQLQPRRWKLKQGGRAMWLLIRFNNNESDEMMM